MNLLAFGSGESVSQFRRELSLLAEESQSFLVHDHAVWLPSNHAVARFCRQHSVRRNCQSQRDADPLGLESREMEETHCMVGFSSVRT